MPDVKNPSDDLTDEQLVKMYRQFQELKRTGAIPQRSRIELYADGSCGIYSWDGGRSLLHYDYFDGNKWLEGPHAKGG